MFLFLVLALFLIFWLFQRPVFYQKTDLVGTIEKVFKPKLPPLDTFVYDKKLEELANNPPAPKSYVATGTPLTSASKTTLWPPSTVYPNSGAILPFKRVVAYYGNLYSKRMGVLGEYPEEEMLRRLENEVKKWEMADPSTPVQPALHYIAVVAQGSAGADGKYRSRMPDTEIEKVLKIADKIRAIVFLDLQVGFSTIEAELPRLEKYLKLPNVHLGLDPEFSMKGNMPPGKVVGTYDAADINYAAEFLARIVKENDLTPKILVVHRYTQKMLTNYKLIKPLPEVQIVMHMDGWGGKAKKRNTYREFVYREPVQFTGFKLFYKNDILDPGTMLFTPEELLKLQPKPIYIQYQ